MSTKFRKAVYHWLHSVQYWLLPGLCLVCQRSSDRQDDLCLACERRLPRLTQACRRCAQPLPLAAAQESECGACLASPPPFRHCLAAYRYEEPVDRLISQLKYHNNLAVARVLGRRLAARVRHFYGTEPLPECLVPVPLHSRRLAQRGYNQALELARPLAAALALPLDRRHCQRPRRTPPQQGLSAAARRRNLRGAFALSADHSFRGRRIALLDDVVTTMSTSGELARLLLDEGAAAVDVWALARA